MFDIGWLELIVIGIVALIVVGPQDLPGMFRTAGRYMGKARAMAREFQRSMEQAADESGLKDAANSLNTIRDPLSSARNTAKSYAKGTFDDDKSEKKPAAEKKPADKPAVKPAKPAKAAAPAGAEPPAEPAPAADKPEG